MIAWSLLAAVSAPTALAVMGVQLGYLLGGNLGRGFPQYVREFNANFLALPALPSERLSGASDDKEIVVRARSRDGRLVITDEEHEPSYKHEEGVRYHARDVAVKRAQTEGLQVLFKEGDARNPRLP